MTEQFFLAFWTTAQPSLESIYGSTADMYGCIYGRTQLSVLHTVPSEPLIGPAPDDLSDTPETFPIWSCLKKHLYFLSTWLPSLIMVQQLSDATFFTFFDPALCIGALGRPFVCLHGPQASAPASMQAAVRGVPVMAVRGML